MERLTEWRGEHAAVVNHHVNYIDRLAAYEDTGLTPAEIEDLISVREISPETEYAINKHADSIIERLDKLLKQTDEKDKLRLYKAAENEDRLVILPCKIGTEIFRIEDDYCERRANDACNEYCNGWDTTCEDYVGEKEVVRGHFCFSDIGDFGKTVFLTRNQADAKLKGES